MYIIDLKGRSSSATFRIGMWMWILSLQPRQFSDFKSLTSGVAAVQLLRLWMCCRMCRAVAPALSMGLFQQLFELLLCLACSGVRRVGLFNGTVVLQDQHLHQWFCFLLPMCGARVCAYCAVDIAASLG